MTLKTQRNPRHAAQIAAAILGHWMTPFTVYDRNKIFRVAVCETCGEKIILDTNGELFAGVAHKRPCKSPHKSIRQCWEKIGYHPMAVAK